MSQEKKSFKERKEKKSFGNKVFFWMKNAPKKLNKKES